MLVVKVGGGEGIDLDLLCDDLAVLWKSGEKVVLVHGASFEANMVSEKLGIPPKFVTSVSGIESRFTDRPTLEVLAMVYAGKANKMIVERLQKRGVNAFGLSGIDGRLLEGVRKDSIKIRENGKKKVLRGDNTGKVEKVNVQLLQMLLDNNYAPVIAPLSISYEGDAINVDGDRASALIAASLHVDQLIILSNVPGLLKDLDDPDSLITSIDKNKIDNFMDFAKRRMKKKVMGAMEAFEGGVKKVVFGDARLPQPVTQAMNGKGTVIL